MPAYYNEFDPYAAQWLRNLIAAGHIAPGDVDERSIVDVRTDDLRGYEQCHFFAGIGGWSYALRLAGWDDTRPVWTGSCPCQPFSNAGRRKGKEDERHLWPYWYKLIAERLPSTVFGEQVVSAIAHGWLDDVQQGMEDKGYAFGSAVLPAISGQRGHGRDRIFFVGDAEYNGQPTSEEQGSDGKAVHTRTKESENSSQFAGASDIRPMADTPSLGQSGQGEMGESLHTAPGSDGQTDKFVDASTGLWWLRCPDGYARNIEPTIPVLAYGVSKHMARVCSSGFGNAIVPQVAAEFIKATM